MADSTLGAIRTKVRRLTRSPSTSQLTDADIDEYVNTFVLYDFPEHLRLFTLRTTLTFYTEPNIDVYETSADPNSPLFDFKDKYITVHNPVYISGFNALLSQSREQFFGIYPLVNTVANTSNTGDGATVAFAGTLSAKPVLINNVLFSSIADNGGGLELHDDGAGLLSGDGNGTIDYVSGAYTLNFTTAAPGTNEPIVSHTVPYNATRPEAVLYFDNTFTFRPVPDQAYRVNLEVYKRPTELLAGESPELEQWWQYIAYGAAKKVFEDRTDEEGVRMILPEFTQQELLVLRRTIVQQTKERIATIYSESSDPANWWGW